jgi:hypothetical protein
MPNNSRDLVFAAILAAALLAGAPAHAQWYSSLNAQPARTYAYSGQQPYAVEIAPNTYVIRRTAPARENPYAARSHVIHVAPEPAAPASDHPHKPANRELIEELRKRSHLKKTNINTARIVRDPPIIIEHKRYVDDPPRIVERQHIVEDEPAAVPGAPVEPVPAPVAPRRKHAVARADNPRTGRDEKRVIQADAEITILGPDRMTIRLFRKGHGPNVKAE